MSFLNWLQVVLSHQPFILIILLHNLLSFLYLLSNVFYLINFTLYVLSVEYFVSLGWFLLCCMNCAIIVFKFILLFLFWTRKKTNKSTKAVSNFVWRLVLLLLQFPDKWDNGANRKCSLLLKNCVKWNSLIIFHENIIYNFFFWKICINSNFAFFMIRKVLWSQYVFYHQP